MTERAYEERTDGGNPEVKEAGQNRGRVIGILEGTAKEGRSEAHDMGKMPRGASKETEEFRRMADLSCRWSEKDLGLPGEREISKDLTTSQEGRGVSRCFKEVFEYGHSLLPSSSYEYRPPAAANW
ncbi:hypothetical protein NDU88_002451 [Pleurodeles waltl]|uniref:Uncharacterized protein n=1 Tax=Pleurodeles waltl TaxID=8319 RepID=A0AAV7VCW2_PLEWA|nr:hypothetical protein NDU88_002451 [Pleurodeles waltl]